MSSVGKWLRLAKKDPLRTKCLEGRYKGWYWETIVAKDPDYVLWILVESKILLEREVEAALERTIAHNYRSGT